jgi:hypothetical protein
MVIRAIVFHRTTTKAILKDKTRYAVEESIKAALRAAWFASNLLLPTVCVDA